MKLGKLETASEIGDEGYIDTSGDDLVDYSSAISRLRMEMKQKNEKIIALLVLPSSKNPGMYYGFKGFIKSKKRGVTFVAERYSCTLTKLTLTTRLRLAEGD